MTDREQAIHAEVERFRSALLKLDVPTYVVCVSFDDTPETGGGLTKVYGDADTIAQMACTIAKNLPPPFFLRMLQYLALSQECAANRGEVPQPVPPIDPKKVN
jgi:hypothetical protein